jgi:molybdenum cofactor synthesis domain-containing protein
MNNQPTAAIVIIGDEILSGRTQDKNVRFLAEKFSNLGILLKEVRIVRDDEEQIITTVNELRKNHTNVITTGGIGATHDDITASSVAKAFGVKLYKDQEAVEMIDKYIKSKNKEPSAGTFLTANVPEGCELIKNAVSGAPGFTIGNVHVLAGIPEIAQSMFQDLSNKLEKGKKFNSCSIKVNIGEGSIIHILSDAQEKHKNIQIGSYPFEEQNNWRTTIVVRGQDLSEVKLVTQELQDIFNKEQIEFTVEG